MEQIWHPAPRPRFRAVWGLDPLVRSLFAVSRRVRFGPVPNAEEGESSSVRHGSGVLRARGNQYARCRRLNFPAPRSFGRTRRHSVSAWSVSCQRHERDRLMACEREATLAPTDDIIRREMLIKYW